MNINGRRAVRTMAMVGLRWLSMVQLRKMSSFVSFESRCPATFFGSHGVGVTDTEVLPEVYSLQYTSSWRKARRSTSRRVRGPTSSS